MPQPGDVPGADHPTARSEEQRAWQHHQPKREHADAPGTALAATMQRESDVVANEPQLGGRFENTRQAAAEARVRRGDPADEH